MGQSNSFQASVSRDTGPKEYKWEAGISDANLELRSMAPMIFHIKCESVSALPSLMQKDRCLHRHGYFPYYCFKKELS